MITFFTYCIFKISSPYIRHQFLQTNFITMTDGDNWFRISQIRILKNFIETKINFSPSPLWFSKSVLWVLAPTFHMTLVQSPLCLYSSMYILREKKKKKPYTTGHFGTINSYNGTPVLAYPYFHTNFDLRQSKRVYL